MSEGPSLDDLYTLLGQIRAANLRADSPESAHAAGQSRREAAIRALAEGGATEGERVAARAALHRLHMDQLDREAEEFQGDSDW